MSGIELALIASTVASAAGQVVKGQAAARAGRSRARLFEAQSRRRRQTAQAEARDKRRETSRLLARQRAAYAASGVDTAGTPIAVGGDTAAEGELQAQRLLVSGLTDSLFLDARADLERSGARDEAAAGYINAGTTLLTGFSRAKFGQKGKKIPTIDASFATGSNYGTY